MSNTPEKKGVSAVDFFWIGFGAIVGVGWAVAINGWMTSCGGPIPAAIGYIVALVMMVPIALCYCELVPMLPVAGGGMAFAYKAFNETVSFISGWAAFGAFVSIIPWEAIQITDVLGYLIPGIKTGPILYKVAGEPIYLITIIIGTVASLLLFALNMRGLAAAASVQKILCFILVGAAVIGAIASLIGGNADNWKPIYDVTDPTIYGNPADGLKQVSHNSMFGGILAILASAPFFLAGFETIPQGIEDAGGDLFRWRHMGDDIQLIVFQQRLVIQRANTHHKKLIHIAAENGGKFDALCQGNAFFFGKGQHAAVKIQPAEFPVDKNALRRVFQNRFLLTDVQGC